MLEQAPMFDHKTSARIFRQLAKVVAFEYACRNILEFVLILLRLLPRKRATRKILQQIIPQSKTHECRAKVVYSERGLH